MALPTVEAPCFVCGDHGAERVWATPDRAFAVPGRYTVVRCRPCGLSHFTPTTLDAVIERAGGRVEAGARSRDSRSYGWSTAR
jgi:hypothetical protein